MRQHPYYHMFHAMPVIIVVFQIDGGMCTTHVAIHVVRTKRTYRVWQSCPK
jgi:hypothetical protein